jgi:type III secretory pathway component EscV
MTWGNLLGKLGQPDRALDQVQKALALARASEDQLAQADSLVLISLILRNHSRTEQALDFLPEALRIYRELVTVLRNLIDEFVPLMPFRGIVETFSRLRAGGAARLEILRAVRCLHEVRPRLPGNNDSHSFYQLASALEEKFAHSIQILDSLPYLAMDPEITQRILKTIRDIVASHIQAVALVVENPAIRRFVRKLVELEFSYLFVLSAEELLPGLEAKIIGEIEWSEGA